MLKSVFNNGGFYIGRYETGTKTARFSNEDELTTPIIQRDAYPYNYVSCKQAKEKSEELKIGERNSSLLFGIQWDLLMRHFQNKGLEASEMIGAPYSFNGNSYFCNFTLTRGMYTSQPATSGSWNSAIGYTKTSNTPIILTTGFRDENCICGIFDLGGNLQEWTNEVITSDSKDSNNNPVHRVQLVARDEGNQNGTCFGVYGRTTLFTYPGIYGFRVALY